MKKINIIYYFNNHSKWVNKTLAYFLDLDPSKFDIHIISADPKVDVLDIFTRIKKSNIFCYKLFGSNIVTEILEFVCANISDGYIWIIENMKFKILSNDINIIANNVNNLNNKINFISNINPNDIVLDNLNKNFFIDFNSISLSNFILSIDFVKENKNIFYNYKNYLLCLVLLFNFNNDVNVIIDNTFINSIIKYEDINIFLNEYININGYLLSKFYDNTSEIAYLIFIRNSFILNEVFNFRYMDIPNYLKTKLFSNFKKISSQKFNRLYPNDDIYAKKYTIQSTK